MTFLTRRQTPEPDVSEAEAASSDERLDAIIGPAAAGSGILILAMIFLGYWVARRRARTRSAPSGFIEIGSDVYQKLEAPRRARRRSLVLSIGIIPPRSSQRLHEKPLPSPPATTSLLSYNAFTITPITATFPSDSQASSPVVNREMWNHSDTEKIQGVPSSWDASLAVPIPPPAAQPRLGLVRKLPVKRPDPIDVQLAQAWTVKQAVDSGLRLVNSAEIVPPPYTPN